MPDKVFVGLPTERARNKSLAMAEKVVDAARDLLDDLFADGDQTFLREELRARIADFDRLACE